MANKRKHNPDAAKARENAKKREEAKKRAQRNAKFAAHKMQIIIAAVVLVVAVVAVTQLADFFYAPGGSLKEFHGKLYGVSANSIVYKSEDNGHYYEAGKFKDPEGFTLSDSIQGSSSDQKARKYYFNANEDESGDVASVYLAGVNKSADEMVETLSGYNLYTNTEVREISVNGSTFKCFYGLTEDATESDDIEPTTGTSSIAAYANCSHGGSVLVMMQATPSLPLADIPDADTLFAQAERFLSAVTVE